MYFIPCLLATLYFSNEEAYLIGVFIFIHQLRL
jgi:hypothetical protein